MQNYPQLAAPTRFWQGILIYLRDFAITNLAAIALCLLALPACGTLPNGRSWGQDVTLIPSYQRLSDAAVSAASHPATWAPLMGAALAHVTHVDDKYTRALADHNPVFGSQKSANHASDMLRSTLVTSAMLTAALTPSGTSDGEFFRNKSKGIITEYAALELTSASTSVIKQATGRQRPNELNNSSFPSGHTSRAFAAAALTSKNLDSLPISARSADEIRIGLYTVACGTAWARVEANMHYVTDVMAGAALGNFLSRFVHDAFLGLDNENQLIEFDIEPHYSRINLVWNF